MAQEDIQMEKYHDAELALEQIDRIHLERCAAVPVKDMILPDEELYGWRFTADPFCDRTVEMAYHFLQL